MGGNVGVVYFIDVSVSEKNVRDRSEFKSLTFNQLAHINHSLYYMRVELILHEGGAYPT